MQFKLTEEILKLSNSEIWESAKEEWSFEYAYYSQKQQTCLCGHSPIRNICVIKNRENRNVTEVGNCCINKFLGIEDGNKIFISIKRLKEDLTKSMSSEVLDYLNSKKILSSFEYDFYTDIIRKRTLTHKQVEVKKRINKKLLDFTSYEANSHFNRINIVLNWAEKNTWFDTNFIQSLKTASERNGKLTENQKTALENMIRKLKIEC